MKKLSLLITLLTLLTTTFAQSIQRITWESNGLKCDALLFIKNNNDILVHVNYIINNVEKVAKFKAKRLYNPDHSPNDIIIQPITPTKTILASNNDLSKVLTPQNILLVNYKKETNKGEKWIVLNNKELELTTSRSSSPAAKSKYYKSITELSNDNINLKKYFPETDSDYQSLLAGTYYQSNQEAKTETLANNNTTVHLFLVGDTLDRAIGKDVINDIYTLNESFQDALTVSPDIALKTTIIAGKDLTGVKISNSLKSLIINPQDVIIFYYGGHGYNFDLQDKKSDFPTMKMISNDLSLEEVHRYIVNTKKPRFSLVMGDLCNTIEMRRPNHNPKPLFGSAMRPSIQKEAVDRLFKYSKGHIISTSSTYDQFSFSISNSGAFSQSFFKIFQNATLGMYKVVDWSVILQKSYDKAFELTKELENKNDQWGQRGFMKGSVTYLNN